MKIVAIAVIFAAVAVWMVKSEDCTNNNPNSCVAFSCSTGFHKECVSGICTCVIDCLTPGDCTDASVGTVCNQNWHCVDNRCRCY